VRVLVLYVDRDGDLKKQGFETPVIGRDEVLRLGIRYILESPDDSDANAIFAAVKIYDRLAAEYGRGGVSVAVVSGSPDESVANLVVIRELEQVLSVFDADVIYFVSDGPSDEAAVPAVQTKRPVISVHRVIVRQARGVEETVALFKHYFNKAVKELRYRRYIIGVPAFLAFVLMLGAAINLELMRRILELSSLFLVFLIALYGLGIYDFLKRVFVKYEITFMTVVIFTFTLTVYFVSAITPYGWIPYGAVIVTSALPGISYVVESYHAERRLKYGGIVACCIVVSFFCFLLPVLLRPRVDLAELMASFVLFLLVSGAAVLAVRVARRLAGGPGGVIKRRRDLTA
jgi:putative membrane protein